jgi:hypothetical protein
LIFPPDDESVVVEVEKGVAGMARRIPGPALKERLGDAGAFELRDMLEAERREWREEFMTAIVERFDRRLAEEVGGLRRDVVEGHAMVRREIAQSAAETQVELRQLLTVMGNHRVEYLRWSFLFWVGQFFAILTLLATFVPRVSPP